MKINVAHIEPESYIYAPEKQFVIWLQGCRIRCEGCWNDKMWSFQKKTHIEIENLIEQIIKIENIKGVTFLGGEPFDQINELLYFVEEIKNRELGVTIYTGYEKNELQTKIAKKILQYTDILISGRYIEALRNDNLQWIGSENQKIDFLSDFYADYQQDNANYCEINISESGAITMLGFPDSKLLKSINQ